MKVMRCNNCDKSLRWQDFYCPECGHRNHKVIGAAFVLAMVLFILVWCAVLIWLTVSRRIFD